MRQARLLLHIEGAVVAAVVVWAYAAQTDASWWLFALLWLVPDLGLLGFLANGRIGAATYNMAHSYVGPVLLAAAGIAAGADTVLAVGLIWTSHAAIDRAVGYGLKSTWSAKHTHLQQLTGPQTDDGAVEG